MSREWVEILQEAIPSLESLSENPENREDLSPATREALLGSLYERKERDPFDKVFPSLSSEDVRALSLRAIERLSALIPVSRQFDPLPTEIGWGTYRWKYGPEVAREALSRPTLIDTAETYGYGKVEKELGSLRVAGTYPARVGTKVSRSHLRAASVRNAVRRSRDNLGSLYSVLLHWPSSSVPLRESMEALEAAREEGAFLLSGVSNVCADQLLSALFYARGGSFIVQVRISREDPSAWSLLYPMAKAMGVSVQSHSPLSQGSSVINPSSWILELLSKGVTPFVGTNSLEHLKNNLELKNG